MYESSGSQFFGTTNQIQSGPGIVDESRFIKTFLTILRVTFVENTISNLRSPKSKVSGKRLFSFTSICRLTASRTLLQQLLACLNFPLDSEHLFCWYKWNKWFLQTMVAAPAAANHGNKWGLTWFLQWEILTSTSYINSDLNPLKKFTSSSRSDEFKDILTWNISEMITKIIPISKKIVTSHSTKQGILFWVRQKITGNWDNNMTRISQWRESYCRTILVS